MQLFLFQLSLNDEAVIFEAGGVCDSVDFYFFVFMKLKIKY